MTAAVAALVRERGGVVALTDITLRAPRPDEIVVRVQASGVCPTDTFGIDGGAGDRFPAVFGHEGAGVVEAVGGAVTRVRPGDHVTLSFASCGACVACDDGHPAYCERFGELNYGLRQDAATTAEPVTTGWMAQSSWATRVITHESSAAVIDPDVPWAVAATLGCGILTGAGTVLNVLRPEPRDVLLVLGAGTTGLAAVMAAVHRGVGTIIVSEPSAERRALAIELGATDACAPEQLDALLAKRPAPTHALDTVGSQQTLDAGITAVGARGVCATVALRPGSNRVAISQSRLLWGRSVVGVIEGDAVAARDVPLLVTLWRAGRLPVERLITTYAFDDIAAAVDDARAGRAIKPVLVMADSAGAAAASTTTGDLTEAGESTTERPVSVRSPVLERMPRAGVPRDLLELLRSGGLAERELPGLWRSLPAVATGELRGLWFGTGLSPRHPAHRLLTRSRWFGKLFVSDDDVAPIVCEGDDGSLYVDESFARGGATLRDISHEGIVVASMVYDGRPVIDHFVRLGPDAVLGVMTGRNAADEHGALYYFMLERVDDRPVSRPSA